MSKKSLGMMYITRLKNGYWVRKTYNYEEFKMFFSFKTYGGVKSALDAAIVYRDQLVEKYGNLFSVKTKHQHNKTGVIGINWNCRTNPVRPSSVINTFRAQAPAKNEESKTATTFSIKKEGLWNAFYMAVTWRLDRLGAFGMSTISFEDTKSAFSDFMHFYISRINAETNVRVRQEMTSAICKLIEDKVTPDEIKECVMRKWVPMADIL